MARSESLLSGRRDLHTRIEMCHILARFAERLQESPSTLLKQNAAQSRLPPLKRATSEILLEVE